MITNKRPFLLWIPLLVISLLPAGCNKDRAKETDVKPRTSAGEVKRAKSTGDLNVLLITIDTVRQDRVGVYSGQYVKTPNIDELAARGYVFKRAFAHNPVTLPSHTNILTGTTPLYHGISDNSGFRLDERFVTIAEHLKDKGYATGAFIGAFPLDSRFGLNQGFDVYDDNYGTHNSLDLFFVERPAKEVIRPTMEWISKGTGKWFAWVHLFDPHQPYAPPPPFDKEYAQDLYSGEVAYMDQELGRLFSFLKDNNMWSNTVIILVADHGEALGEKGEKTHSYFAYNNTILIPLIIYVPGEGAKTIDENVAHVDIFPTICDLLGIEIPGFIQGESLLPIVAGEARKNKEIYFESMTPHLNRGWAPLQGFVRDDLKFIDLPIKEVYDLEKDIQEDKNLVSSSRVRDLVKDLDELKKALKGEFKAERKKQLDPEVQRRLKSLGYLSGTSDSSRKVYTRKDDLKTLLPLQNRMLDALGKAQFGHPGEAIADLNSIIQESPGFILVYNNLANLYKDTGQIQSAIDVLKGGLKKNPGNLSLLSRLGIILAEAGEHKEAIEVLEGCVTQESFNPENFNYLGVAYYRSGNAQAALDNYRKALELDSNYASVYNNIGSLYLSLFLGKKDEAAYARAMENFNKAIEIDPRLSAAYNGRGAAFHFKSEFLKAIQDWKKAIEIDPDFIDPYFSIGLTYLRLKDKKSALDHFLLFKDRLYSRLPLPAQQRLDRLIAEARY